MEHFNSQDERVYRLSLRNEQMGERIKKDRRSTNALLRRALVHNDLEIDTLDTPNLRHLPNVSHGHKRGKGVTYDRARSSEWKRSTRTEFRRNCDEGIARVSDHDLPQVKKHILEHRDSIRAIFAGYVLPGDRELTRKELLRKKDELEQRMDGKEGSEKHAVLLQISHVNEQIEALWSGLEPYQRNAYWVFINTRKKVAKAQRKSSQSVHVSKKGRKNRATKTTRLSHLERNVWKNAKEDLHRHNLAKGYEVEA